MSCKAAILILFANTSTRQGEDIATARKLRCNFVDVLMKVIPLHQVTGVIPSTCNPDTPQAATPEPSQNLPPPTAPVLQAATPEPSQNPLPPTAPVLETATPELSQNLPPPATPEPSQNLACLTAPVLGTATPEPPTVTPSVSKKSSIRSVSTESLLLRQQSIRDQQPQGRKFKSRTVARRLSLQKEELANLAKTVHHGSKQDFLASLAQSVDFARSNSLSQQAEEWDGSLSPQDIITLAKQAHDPRKGMSLYDTIITEDAAQHFHLSASDVLDI